MPKKIKIKNTLPDILSALCSHKDCSDWLKTTIWNKLNDNADIPTDSPETIRANAEIPKART